MRRLRTSALVVVLALSASFVSSVEAGTDQEAFEKLWNKLLVSTAKFKPKIACICTSSNELGVLTAPPVPVPPYLAYCTTPTFDADGNVQSFTNCGAFTIVKP